jgi:NAD(P)H-nitrite reductase large subunit
MLLEDLDEDEVFVKPEKWFDENNIIIKLGEKIENVDPDNKTITTASGNKVSYDKLILAHGSYCLIPAIEGSKNKGVFALRHLDDLKNIKEHTSKIESVVVVGGGLLGLESAWHLSQLGKKVSILEISNRILPYQLNEDASYIYENVIKQKNIDIIKGKFVRRVLGSSDVEGIEFEDGTKLDAGAVIFAIGICPNRQLVENRGFKLNRGVDVNGKMETGINDVYACGDIAEFNGVVYGNWDAAINMAKVAGANAAGDNKVFKPAVKAYVLSAMDTEIFSTGDLGLDDKDFRAYSNKDYNANFYKKALFKNNMMCGSIIIGDTKDSLKYLRAVKEGATPEEFIEMGIL